MSEFIFMLTHHDVTVPDALEVWASVRETGLKYAGFKDIGIDAEPRKRLVDSIRETGRPAMLEVVSVSRDDEMRAVESAISLGIDYLLGGTHADEVAPMLAGTSIRYFPFPGRIVGHPSVLEGTAREIASDARRLTALEGVAGLDLLAYRHADDPEGVAAAVIKAVQAPVLIAGSIASVERVRRVSDLGAWAFTVGSALFEGHFGRPGDSMRQRIEAVLAASES